jgi:hypothetical protein
VQVEPWLGLSIEPPAGVAARAEGIVIDIIDCGYAPAAELAQRFGPEGERLVEPGQVHLVLLCEAEHIAIEAAHFDADLGAELKFTEQAAGVVLLMIQWDDFREPEAAQSGETKGTVIVGRKA